MAGVWLEVCTKTTEMPVVFLLGFLVEGFSFSPTVRTGQCKNPRTKTKKFSFSFSSDDKERPKYAFLFFFFLFSFSSFSFRFYSPISLQVCTYDIAIGEDISSVEQICI